MQFILNGLKIEKEISNLDIQKINQYISIAGVVTDLVKQQQFLKKWDSQMQKMLAV